MFRKVSLIPSKKNKTSIESELIETDKTMLNNSLSVKLNFENGIKTETNKNPTGMSNK